MYDVPTHAKLSKELKSPTILGSAVAMMDAGSYNEMTEKKLPMKMLYQDSRRIVVVKP